MKKAFYGIGLFSVLFLLAIGIFINYQWRCLDNKMNVLQKQVDMQEDVQTEVMSDTTTKYKTYTFELYNSDTDTYDSREFRLTSYSLDGIVLRQAREDKRLYCLKESGGYIVVYDQTSGDVFEYTDILLSHLPLHLQESVKEGFSLEGTEELYDFLENYSS